MDVDDESRPISSSRSEDSLGDVPKNTNNTNSALSSKLQVKFDPLFRHITEKYTHPSDFWHALNVFHHVKKKRRISYASPSQPCSVQPTDDIPTHSSLEDPPAPTTKPSFTVVDLDSLKISASILLPEQHESCTVAGHIIGIDAINYKSDNVMNLMVLYSIDNDGNSLDPSPTSKYFAILCPMSFVPIAIVKKMQSQNTKWVKDWRMREDWNYQPTQEIKMNPYEEAGQNFVIVHKGPKPLVGKIFDNELAESLTNGLIFYKSRKKKHEYKMITQRPFFFSVPMLLANIYILTNSESSFFNLLANNNRKNLQLVMDIASTKKYSLCGNVIQNTKLYDTFRRTLDSKDKQVLSDDQCLQYALCGDSSVSMSFGSIHHS